MLGTKSQPLHHQKKKKKVTTTSKKGTRNGIPRTNPIQHHTKLKATTIYAIFTNPVQFWMLNWYEFGYSLFC